MARHIYIVGSGFADPGQEAAWNEWYENVHLPRILAVRGFHGAARFRRLSGQAPDYLALYDIEGPQTLEQDVYKALPGWESWRPYITDWSRRVYAEVADLGSKYREAPGPDETHR